MKWPKTVHEAAQRALGEMDDAKKQRLASLTEHDLIEQEHFGIGLWVRNTFGLADGSNHVLLEDCAKTLHPNQKHATVMFHPDDASSVILAHIWKQLN